MSESTPAPKSGTPDALVAQWIETEPECASTARDSYHYLEVRPPTPTVYVKMSRSGKRINPALLETFAKLVLGELPWPLFLHGDAGTGKTRAALYFCDCVESATYHTAEQIADAIMDSRFPDLTPYALIVLDELAERTKSSDLGYQAVKRVLDQRERHNHNAMVIVSNFAPDDLEEVYDGRIVSRLKAGTIFHLQAKDRRAAQ